MNLLMDAGHLVEVEDSPFADFVNFDESCKSPNLQEKPPKKKEPLPKTGLKKNSLGKLLA